MVRVLKAYFLSPDLEFHDCKSFFEMLRPLVTVKSSQASRASRDAVWYFPFFWPITVQIVKLDL